MSNKSNPNFTINNFRIFDKPYTFELAPITILTGPNNSGKSSLLKALNLLNNNKINGRLRNFIDFNSKESRLYGAENVFNDNKKNVEYSFESIIEELSIFPVNYKISFDMEGFMNGFSIKQNNQVLISYVYHTNSFDYSDISFDLDLLMKTFNINNPLFELEFDDEYALNLDMVGNYISTEKNIISNFTSSIKNDSYHPIDSVFADFSEDKFLKYKDYFIHTNRHSTINEVNEALIEQVFRYLKDKIQKDLDSIFFKKIKLSASTNGLILMDKLLILARSLDAFLIKYEFHELLVNRNVKTRNIDLTDETILLNRLVKKYKENIDPNDTFDYGDWVNAWLKKFEIGKCFSVDNFNGEIANLVIHDFNNKKRDLSACGTGVTQVISLLLLRLLNRSLIERLNGRVLETSQLKLEDDKWLIYLEEPESNLHPNWQSLIMELIIDINQKSGIDFIIETHSEYMIRKLQFLMADKTKNLETDSALIYYFNSDKNVDESKGEPKIKKIKIDKNGALSDNFGPGFYDEAINIQFDLLKLNKHQSN